MNPVKRTLIKICGLKDTTLALHAAQCGADYIGLVFHPASPRHVTIPQAQAIVQALKKTQACPVAVMMDQQIDEIVSLCKQTAIRTVQLHGRSRDAHALLPDYIQRFYVISVDELNQDLNFLDPTRDYLLIDHSRPGSGQAFNWDQLHYTLPFPWFLAGGLNVTNVKKAVFQLNPDGVDVSSGVEKSLGEKNSTLISALINQLSFLYRSLPMRQPKFKETQ